MIHFSAIAENVNRAFDFPKRRRAVCLLLAVISCLHFAARKRNVRRGVRIDLDRPGARARIPDCRLAAAQAHGFIRRRVASVRSHAVLVFLVELHVALGVDLFGILCLARKDGGHILRSDRPRGSIWVFNHRIDHRPGAARGRAVARQVSTLEKLTVKARSGQCLFVGFSSLLHRLDVQLGVADGFGLFQIFAGSPPGHLDRIRRQAFAGRARIGGARLWRGKVYDRASLGAHFFQETAFALRLEIQIQSRRAVKLHFRIRVERLRAHVARGIGALQALIGVQEEIHVDGMRFGRMPFVHRTQIRVAAHFDLLQLRLRGNIRRRVVAHFCLRQFSFEKNRRQGVATHHVAILLGGRAPGKSYAHRSLFKHGLRRMNHDRQRARAGQLFRRLRIFRVCVCRFRILQRVGCDRDFDFAAQLQTLVLVVDHRAGRPARNIFAFERDGLRCFGHFGILVIQDGFSFYFQRVVRFDLHVAVEFNQSVLLIIKRAARSNLIGLVARGRKDLQVDVFQFVMTVGIGNVARGAQPQIKTIVFGDALFVAVNDAGNFFGERGTFGLHAKRRVVAHLVIGHADKNPSGNQQKQCQRARQRGNTGAQVNCADSFSSDYLHEFPK